MALQHDSTVGVPTGQATADTVCYCCNHGSINFLMSLMHHNVLIYCALINSCTHSFIRANDITLATTYCYPKINLGMRVREVVILYDLIY